MPSVGTGSLDAAAAASMVSAVSAAGTWSKCCKPACQSWRFQCINAAGGNTTDSAVVVAISADVACADASCASDGKLSDSRNSNQTGAVAGASKTMMS